MNKELEDLINEDKKQMEFSFVSNFMHKLADPRELIALKNS